MKPKLILLSILCILAATTAFGQTTYTWIGTRDGGDPTNMCIPGNWTTNEPTDPAALTLPSGNDNGAGDIVQWDGQSPGNVAVDCTYTNGWLNSGGGTKGINLVVTANQTASVQIHPAFGAGGTGNIGLDNITINSASASLRLGDGTGNANILNFVLRPGNVNQLHDWVNDSANPAYIYPNVRWQAGGNAQYILDFDGTGNWVITNTLINSTAGTFIEKSGTGTMYWNGPSTSFAVGDGPINSPITINIGTMVLQWNNSQLNNLDIVNNGSLQYDAPGQGQMLKGAVSSGGNVVVVAGTLTLAGNNSYSGGTSIAGAGTLQIGAGGTNGSAGQGNIDDDGTLVFDRSDSVILTNSIYEDAGYAGSVVQEGFGTLTLAGGNSYTGATIVSNGTVAVNGSVEGDLDVSGGTIQPAIAGLVGTLSVGGNMNIAAGTVMVALNEGLSPSNSLFLVTSNITYTGGTLKLVNYGPAPAVGDTFTVFSQAVTGGAGMTIVSPGFTVANNLASNGSVTVTTTASSAAEITVSASNGQVSLAWPAIWTGLQLQVLTDPVGGGINSTNWVTIAGSDARDTYAASLSLTNNVFYRLAP